jgi:hypothetical protein
MAFDPSLKDMVKEKILERYNMNVLLPKFIADVS